MLKVATEALKSILTGETIDQENVGNIEKKANKINLSLTLNRSLPSQSFSSSTKPSNDCKIRRTAVLFGLAIYEYSKKAYS
jgi:hypothetical protein